VFLGRGPVAKYNVAEGSSAFFLSLSRAAKRSGEVPHAHSVRRWRQRT
jgi:hypothetical protein